MELNLTCAARLSMIAPSQGLSSISEKHRRPVSLKHTIKIITIIVTIMGIILDELNPSLLFKVVPLLISLFHKASEVWIRVSSSGKN